ncbi:uncharacterized protein [Leptinotarsa decemlineata]|uniref:uncharacterized protein n=1 Tax=Leptinotarsa decemlineata TaxID=7539 RepID=UPI003D304291
MSVEKKVHECLTKKLKSLASSHYHFIKSNDNTGNNDDNSILCKLNVEDFINFVEHLGESDISGKIDFEVFKHGVKQLVECNKDVCEVLSKNPRVLAEKSGAILQLVYEVLLVIFSKTNQLDRQFYFHEWLQCYYAELKKHFMQIDFSSTAIFSQDCYEYEVKKCLLFAKVETARQSFYDSKQNHKTLELVQELIEHFKNPNLSREDCYVAVKNKLKSKEISFIGYQLEALNERLGFLGDYYQLKITVKHNERVELLKFFAKYLPTTNETTKSLALLSFNKERFIYQTFIPVLNELGFEELTDFAPKCFFARSNDVLVLEDVSILRYKSSDIHTPVSYEWLVIVSKLLAKFHACSILYEEKIRSKLNQEYCEYLKEISFTTEPSGAVMLRGARTVVELFMDILPTISKRLGIESLKRKVDNAFSRMFQILKEPSRFRSVICHGDLWGSNILTKSGQDGKPKSCFLVDYQLTRYGPPAMDLLFLLYTNTDKETRKQYMDAAVREYHEELSRILNKYDVDVNNIYDFETFLESCEYVRSAVICQAACYLQILLCPKEKIKMINDSPEDSLHFYLVDRSDVFLEAMEYEPFRKRMEEIVEDLCEV